MTFLLKGETDRVSPHMQARLNFIGTSHMAALCVTDQYE
jgi:hypothetical protein